MAFLLTACGSADKAGKKHHNCKDKKAKAECSCKKDGAKTCAKADKKCACKKMHKKDGKNKNKSFAFEKTKNGYITTLKGDFFFASGKAELSAKSEKVLKKIAKGLKKQADKGAKIAVKGYADSSGDAELNKTLSAARAKAVYDQLVKAGVKKDNLTHKGFGADNPIASNATKEGREQNRRVELHVTFPKK